MTKSILQVLLPPVALLLIACPSATHQESAAGKEAIQVSDLESRIRTLSSDEFLGRKPFTEGETKTLEYLQNEYKKIGLEPANGDRYLQEVPLVEIMTTADSVMKVSTPRNSFQLQGRDDYVIWSKDPEGATLSNDEVVFAGYGIVAPEYDWNDYKGLDVKGKIVMVLVNDPGFGMGDSLLFKGNTMTYYGRWTYKFEEAARQGAKGCLVIHDEVPASYGFWVVQNSWNTRKLYLDMRNSSKPECKVEGWVSLPTAKKLLEAGGLDYTKQLSAAHRNTFTGQVLNVRLTTSMKVDATYNTSYNVIGKVTGSVRPDEYIIYTAHWDHLGFGAVDAEGDSIFNGALDNASGTAGMLEIAEAFVGQDPKPERTVIFLAVTAEEQGLLGSAYYAENPIYSKEQTVANINIDGVNIYGKMNDLALVGMGQSELEEYLAEEAKHENRYLAPDPLPSAGYYFRSDHFNFAKIGVPSLYTHPGIDHQIRGKDFGRSSLEEYNSKFYHKQSDEYDSVRWNLEGSVADLELLYRVGKRLADESSWPQWKDGSEFKSIREKYKSIPAAQP